MTDHWSMPADRTYCGKFRCCREKNHEGGCEEDITYLTDKQLEAIRDSSLASKLPKA